MRERESVCARVRACTYACACAHVCVRTCTRQIPQPPPHAPPPYKSVLRVFAGRVTDESALRQRVFASGLEHPLRREAWKFLLGYHSLRSSRAQRVALRADKRAEYTRLKAQWTSITEAQAARWGVLLALVGWIRI